MQKAPHLDVFVMFYEQMTFLGSITDSKWVYLGPPSLLASNGETGAPCTGATFLPSSEMSGVPQWGGPFVLPTAEKTCSYCDFATAVVLEMWIKADRDGDIYIQGSGRPGLRKRVNSSSQFSRK